jgi:MoaA/NifB/PqqE/SkfB family radical SAM enzyme
MMGYAQMVSEDYFPLLRDEYTIYVQPHGNLLYSSKVGDIVAYLNDDAVKIISYCDGNHKVQDIANPFDEGCDTARRVVRDFFESSVKLFEYRSKTKERRRDPIVIGQGSPTLIKANIEITSQCNLRCSYCLNSCAASRHDELNCDDWLAVIDLLKSKGVRSLVFTGGEPFTKKFFWKILESAVKNFDVAVLTNGFFLRDLGQRRAQLLKETKRIQISVDSHDPARHDRHRGRGSWKRAMEAVKLLKSLGIWVETSTVILPEDNEEELRRTKEFLEGLGVDKVIMEPVEVRGRAYSLGIQRTLFYAQVKDYQNRKLLPTLDDGYSYGGQCLFKLGVVAIRPNGYLKYCPLPDEIFEFWYPNLTKTDRYQDLATKDLTDLELYKLLKTSERQPNAPVCIECPLFSSVCPGGCSVAPRFLSDRKICKIGR